MSEETGLTVWNLSLCSLEDWVECDTRYVIMYYKTDAFSEKLRSSEEGEVKWVHMSELDNMTLARGFKEILTIFLDDTLSERYFYLENGRYVEAIK